MAKHFLLALILVAAFATGSVSAAECQSYGEVLTVYNSDGALIGIVWVPEKGTTLEYLAGPDRVPRFVARRPATTSDQVPKAASIEDAERATGAR